MVLKSEICALYFDHFVRAVEKEDSHEGTKSLQSQAMIRTMLDCANVHGLFHSSDASLLTQGQLLKLRTLMISWLRDADSAVRFIGTEGVARLLISNTCDKPRDFIARFILI